MSEHVEIFTKKHICYQYTNVYIYIYILKYAFVNLAVVQEFLLPETAISSQNGAITKLSPSPHKIFCRARHPFLDYVCGNNYITTSHFLSGKEYIQLVGP